MNYVNCVSWVHLINMNYMNCVSSVHVTPPNRGGGEANQRGREGGEYAIAIPAFKLLGSCHSNNVAAPRNHPAYPRANGWNASSVKEDSHSTRRRALELWGRNHIRVIITKHHLKKWTSDKQRTGHHRARLDQKRGEAKTWHHWQVLGEITTNNYFYQHSGVRTTEDRFAHANCPTA